MSFHCPQAQTHPAGISDSALLSGRRELPHLSAEQDRQRLAVVLLTQGPLVQRPGCRGVWS